MKNVMHREYYVSGGKVLFQEHRGSKVGINNFEYLLLLVYSSILIIAI